MALIFTAETSRFWRDKLRTQREEQWIEIVFDKTPYTPYQDEYEQMLYPTVRISSPTGIGSGVVIQTKELKNQETEEPISSSFRSSVLQLYVLTAAHVVDNQSVVNVELYDSTVITASVVITDTAKDLALLSIEHSASAGLNALRPTLYAACLAPKDYTPYIFTPVYSVGCSLGLLPRPSAGMITAISHQDTKTPSSSCLSAFVADYWEVSSPILPGNSGGPVYDAHTYEVIGIAVWVHTYQGQLITTMGGVVPINEIYNFLDNHKDTKFTEN
jgi:S1-C subfamily serine protease